MSACIVSWPTDSRPGVKGGKTIRQLAGRAWCQAGYQRQGGGSCIWPHRSMPGRLPAARRQGSTLNTADQHLTVFRSVLHPRTAAAPSSMAAYQQCAQSLVIQVILSRSSPDLQTKANGLPASRRPPASGAAGVRAPQRLHPAPCALTPYRGSGPAGHWGQRALWRWRPHG